MIPGDIITLTTIGPFKSTGNFQDDSNYVVSYLTRAGELPSVVELNLGELATAYNLQGENKFNADIETVRVGLEDHPHRLRAFNRIIARARQLKRDLDICQAQ